MTDERDSGRVQREYHQKGWLACKAGTLEILATAHAAANEHVVEAGKKTASLREGFRRRVVKATEEGTSIPRANAQLDEAQEAQRQAIAVRDNLFALYRQIAELPQPAWDA